MTLRPQLHRTRNRRRAATAAVAVATALSLAACGISGGPDTSDGPTAPPTTEGATVALSGEISFQTWNLKASFQDYFEGLVKEFETQNPGVTVTWIDQPADGYADKLSADAAAGTLPDVVNIDPGTGYPLAEAGMLLDIAAADPSAKDDFLPEAWEGATWPAVAAGGPGTFSYPWYLNTGPSLFNTALFTQAGMDPATLPATYDELFDQAGTMAGAAKGAYTMVGSSPTIEIFGMYGVEVMNADQTEFTFNEPKGVELVQRYKELYEGGGMLKESLSQTYTGQDEQFQSAKIAYMPGSAYNVDQIKQNAPSVYESLEIAPIITNAQPNMYLQYVAVNKATKNPDAAIAFAKFVTNKDNQLAFAKIVNIFPSTADTLDDPYFTKSDGTDSGDVRVLAAEQLRTAVAYSPPMFTEAMKTELRDQIAKAIMGQKDVKQALDDAVAYCDDRIAG